MKAILLSSLGRKYLMAVTGLILILFLIVHLIGNLFLYVGSEAFDNYSEKMMHNPLIRIMEVVIFLAIMLHVVDGLILAYQNRKSRPVPYAKENNKENCELASRITTITAIFVLVFLVIHLKTFRVNSQFSDTPVSMYDLVVHSFRSPFYSLFYVVSMGFLFFHLFHGFQSAFQSLGINHSQYTPIIIMAGKIFAVFMALAFSSFPIYFYFSQL